MVLGYRIDQVDLLDLHRLLDRVHQLHLFFLVLLEYRLDLVYRMDQVYLKIIGQLIDDVLGVTYQRRVDQMDQHNQVDRVDQWDQSDLLDRKDLVDPLDLVDHLDRDNRVDLARSDTLHRIHRLENTHHRTRLGNLILFYCYI